MARKIASQRLSITLVSLTLLLTPLLAVARPQPAAAAGVVSTCTEAALRSTLEGGGLVTFSCSGTIPIANQIVIEADTTIDGGGLVTLDGGGVTRLIRVPAGVQLTLRGLTLTGGHAVLADNSGNGGAILNGGTLTIESSTLSGNSSEGHGGAIHSSGVLTISASTLAGNTALSGAWGGAIFNNGGVVTITDSVLDGNAAGAFGGAIYDSTNGTITIIASTLSDNTVNFGGAIFNNPDTNLTIIASTLAGNSANFGGAIYNGGGLTITTSTLAGNSSNNGAAIYTFSDFGGSATLTANILSGSGLLCIGPITSNGYNVASDATCNLTAAGDLQNANPLLGPLMNNGGPTETFMPQTGSPALGRVANAVCVGLAAANNGQDQRGVPRPESNGLPCDSGSVELQANNFFCVGERSGALRYVNVSNGCVRGEYRLLPTVEGMYAFCVGDRSGAMRYLMSSGASCLRGEWKLMMPEVSPITICVGERSRAVRYVANAGQCNARGELPYVIVNPVG